MNNRQKLGYMALGAGILALGITIGQWTTPDIEAQNNGVFDEITCQRLEVLDSAGNPAIVLVSAEQANAMVIHDRQGDKAVILASVGQGNFVRVDHKGKEAVGLYAHDTTRKVTISGLDEQNRIMTGIEMEVGDVGNNIVLHGKELWLPTVEISGSEGGSINLYSGKKNSMMGSFHLWTGEKSTGVRAYHKTGNITWDAP